MKNGVVDLYKEPGCTSFQAIRQLKTLLCPVKIGHTGTLDPLAEGVLPVCLGKATKAAELFTQGGKTYRAELAFGAETDTQDASGKVTRTQAYVFCRKQVEEAVRSFEGGYNQVPPMYSAVWKDGKRLYSLARKGIEVEREPRRAEISRITILSLTEKAMTLEVDCSKGTYIRTLCEDIGRKCGYLAYMTHLVRTRSGPFLAEDSFTLGQIEALVREGRGDTCIVPLDTVFASLPQWTVPAKEDVLLRAGNYLTYPTQPGWQDGAMVRMKLSSGELAALYKVASHPEPDKTRLTAFKMFI